MKSLFPSSAEAFAIFGAPSFGMPLRAENAPDLSRLSVVIAKAFRIAPL
jgi:hypothetical protein